MTQTSADALPPIKELQRRRDALSLSISMSIDWFEFAHDPSEIHAVCQDIQASYHLLAQVKEELLQAKSPGVSNAGT